MLQPVWIEIDTKAIRHNFLEVKRLVGSQTKIMAVVKADAYGHGAFQVGKVCLEAGADRLAVANLQEAIMLRKQGITCPIMVLGWTPPENYQQALDNEIILTMYDVHEAEQLNALAESRGEKALIHLKIDTGMSRLGLVANEDNIKQAAIIMGLSFVNVEGIYTHFSKADEKDKAYSHWQLNRFLDFTAKLEENTGRKIPLKHAANSAAIIDLPEAHLDLVRPGIILYGLKPSSEVDLSRIDLRPAFSLKARVTRVAKFPPGTQVSYGGIFTTQRETLVASLPLGYADGYTRLLTGKAEVLGKGQRLPVIGKICMDQCMIDITDSPEIKKGDVVILIGKGEKDEITVDEIAYKLGTINYEVICMFSSRIPRVYISE